MENAVSFVVRALDKLFEFADQIYTACGVYPFIYGLFFLFVVVRFLLIPIIGGSMSAGSSDIAAKVRKGNRIKRGKES